MKPTILLSLLLCLLFSSKTFSQNEPNIILVIADDMGWNQVSSDKTTLLNGSSYESDFYETPTIETLAEEGIAFPYGYVNGGNCAPTRAALLSGQYAARPYNNVFTVYDLNRGNTSGNSNLIGPVMGLASNGNIDELPTEAITIAEVMKMGDYTTAHFGKYHVGEHDGAGYTEVSMNGPTRQGFDYNYGGGTDGGPGNYFSDGSTFENKIGTELDPYAGNYTQSEEDALVARYPDPYPTNPSLAGEPYATLAGTPKHVSDAMAEAAMDFIGVEVLGDPINKDKPFFMHYSNFAIHGPFSDPHARPDFLVKYKAKSTSSIYDHGSNPAQGAIAEGMDQSIGRLIDYLRTTPDPRNSNKPLSENTIVYFISDNGDAIKRSPQFPLRGMKGEYYEGGIRSVTFAWTEPADPIGNPTFTPLLHNMGTVNTTPIVAFDLYPTFAEAAGIDISALPDPLNSMETYDIDGVSQWQLLTNGTPMTRESIFWHHPGYLLDNKRDSRPVTVVRKGNYKLMHFYEDSEYELYDVVNDISETTNLLPSSEQAVIDIANDMVTDMIDHLNETNAPLPTFRSGGEAVPMPAAVSLTVLTNSTAGCQPETGYTAFYDFDTSNSPITNDASGAGNHDDGVTGAVSPDFSDFKEGDQSAYFNGSTKVKYNKDPLFLNEEVVNRSIAVWLKPTNLSGIKNIYDEGSQLKGIGLRLNGNKIEASVRTNELSEVSLQIQGDFPNDNEWHHVVFVFKGGDYMKLYVDGIEEATSDVTFNISKKLYAGNNGGIGGVFGTDAFSETDDNANFFIGKMDAFAIYNTPLDFSAVQSMSSLWYADIDADGYGDANVSLAHCSQPLGYVSDNTDCDDNNANINPGKTEIPYNGIDDDCDALTLDDDLDSDGYINANDCDDTNANINPGKTEIPYNGIDDDCDALTLDDDLDSDGYDLADDCDDNNANINSGKTEIPYNGIDDDCDAATLDDDLDSDGYDLADDCDDTDANINPGKTEIPYNGIDDDCDALTLDDDLDSDGYINANDCDDTNANINPGKTEIPYNGIDDDCDAATLDDDLDSDGYDLADDCDDTNANINPGKTEIPYNGIDDDCDALTLDDDLDSDGYINANDCDDTNANINPGKTEIPYNGIDDDCDAATLDDDLDSDGYINANDCDDTNANINPGKTEIPYNGIDDDCNALTLDDDLDSDGYINANDCDDTNANINPGKTEIPYNGIDDDCDALTLDDDLDSDGYINANDCDDTNANINPGKTEIPYNGIDDDCDALTLDDDIDEDGYSFIGDCDDNNFNINPGATEIPGNLIDEDCDGIAQTTLGNNDFKLENVLITPNPFNENITIKVPIGYYNHDFNVTLFDLNGRTIFNTIEASNNGKLNISNGLIELNNGAYFIQITSKELGTSVIKKLIKY